MKAFPWVVAGVGLGAAIAYLLLSEPKLQDETGWASVEDAAGKTWGWGGKQSVAGAGTSVVGKLKEGVGRITGDNDLADEGATDQVAGSVKSAMGKVARAVGQTIHDLNR